MCRTLVAGLGGGELKRHVFLLLLEYAMTTRYYLMEGVQVRLRRSRHVLSLDDARLENCSVGVGGGGGEGG